MSRSEIVNILIKLYIIIPSVLLIITVFISFNSYKKIKSGTFCEGVIVDIKKNTSGIGLSSEKYIAIFPVIKYYVKGKEYTIAGNFYSTAMKIGDKLELLYDKNAPENAIIKKGLLFAPLILGALTVIFILPIIVYFILVHYQVVNF